jgi:hypothetical protein
MYFVMATYLFCTIFAEWSPPLTVTLNTTDGKVIPIELVGAKVIDMTKDTTLIFGKNFDIFAAPEKKDVRGE